MNSPVALKSPSQTSTAAAPRTIGIWRLTGLLHAGSWCDLYAAQPADAAGSPRSDYVLKTARTPLRIDPEAARQIRAEGTAGSVVRHPNLVPILDGHLEGPSPYLVMPRIAGTTIAGLAQRAVQPVPVVLWWIRQAAQALAALHSAGWTHGDVNPENLLVDGRGHVTLIDYGLAQRSGTEAGAAFRGSPQFAAPERLALASPWSGAGDIYSLGVILKELISRHRVPAEPVLGLAKEMLADHPRNRPSALELVEELLRLEIDNLHLHIQPAAIFDRRVA